MRFCVIVLIVATTLLGAARDVSAQTVGEVFRKVDVSVVVIRARGRDVAAGGDAVRFTEIGSGVLISSDGRIMTAAHVVQRSRPGIDAGLMDAGEEDGVARAEDVVGAVPVMDVPVEDEDPARAERVERAPRRHRHLVEEAEA